VGRGQVYQSLIFELIQPLGVVPRGSSACHDMQGFENARRNNWITVEIGCMVWWRKMEAEGKKSLRDFLLVRESESLALASASRFAGSPHAARNPCYAPRPAGSIPAW
jgi:hypothetical protein